MITGNRQQPGEGFEYAKAGQEFRNEQPMGDPKRKGSSNLASLKYQGPGGPRFPGEPGSNTIGFIPAKGDPTDPRNHGEQRLLESFEITRGAQPTARLQELFTERYPCSGKNSACRTVIAKRVPQLFGMTVAFKLYYIVPWVPGDRDPDKRLKDGYAALDLALNG